MSEHIARLSRGLCAGCGIEIEPGQQYRQATRYLTHAEHVRLNGAVDIEAERKAMGVIHGGRISISLHEDCPHPSESIQADRIAERREESRRVDIASFSVICVKGTVPGFGGKRATCPACDGKGCNG